MKLPVNVTAPMRMVMTTETPISIGSGSGRLWTTSHAATSADARPPNPLKAATICGIAVILTRRAAQPPSTPPTTSPPTIVPQVTTLVANKVITIAPSMPTPAIALPWRAVRGPLIRFSPMMNATEQRR